MTVLEAIDLFKTETFNEIYNSMADEYVKDQLIEDIKEVEQTVIDTYIAELKIHTEELEKPKEE